MAKSERNWRGSIIAEDRHIVYSQWGWGDPNCKSRVRLKLTYRLFYTEPIPPKSSELFDVVPAGEENCIVCYSNGKYLISLEPIKEEEWIYYPTLWDKIKFVIAVFISNNKGQEE